MGAKLSALRKRARVFLGLSAVMLWLFIMLMYGMQVAESYESTINNTLGIQTTRIVES